MFKKYKWILLASIMSALTGCATTALTPQDIQNDVYTIAFESPTSACMGIAVQSMNTGEMYYAMNMDKAFVPASNLKLFTAAAALLYLGPNYQYQTSLVTANDNVYLKFTGDPDLTSDDVENLIRQLKAKGLQTINGNFYIDNSQYNGDDLAPGWSWDDLAYCYGAPIDAIMIDHNCIIQPNAQPEDDDPANQYPYRYAAELIKQSLRREGIRLNGQILPGVSDNNAEIIATHCSLPLSQLIKQMLKNSDNVIASSLLKTLGATFYRQPGNWTNGVSAMQTILTQHYHIDFTEARMVDGSGLSRYDLITPSQTLQLLNGVYHDQMISTDFINALPTAGVDGTLKHRMVDANARGRVHAKTGTMSGVSSLSGYANGPHQHVYAFVIFTNNIAGCNRSMTLIEDTIANLLTT